MWKRSWRCWTNTWTPAPSWLERGLASPTSPLSAPCSGCTNRFDRTPSNPSLSSLNNLLLPNDNLLCRSLILLSASLSPTWPAGLSPVSISLSSRPFLEKLNCVKRWPSLMVSRVSVLILWAAASPCEPWPTQGISLSSQWLHVHKNLITCIIKWIWCVIMHSRNMICVEKWRVSTRVRASYPHLLNATVNVLALKPTGLQHKSAPCSANIKYCLLNTTVCWAPYFN